MTTASDRSERGVDGATRAGPTVAIVGMGHVGRCVFEVFPNAVCYDKHISMATQESVNHCDVAIVCTPTPRGSDGQADVRSVEEVVGWLETDLIVIRSTVPPGTTDRLLETSGKRIVVAPEFIGEWTQPTPWEATPRGWPFVITGGRPFDTSKAVALFAKALGPIRIYRQTTARTAELCKYMENAWLAMQVSFANEFWDIAQAHNVDYWELRELWALDPRVSRAHTVVDPSSRGFGGHCLPKDLHAIIASSKINGYEPALLRSVLAFNEGLRDEQGSAGDTEG
jgi:UDPglucose 6-dehydrogenase